MRILTICLALVLVIAWAMPGRAVKKVPKQGKQDSTRTEVAPKSDAQPDGDKKPPAKDDPRLDSAPPPKDSFIDRDGDGINDNLNRRKPPEIKKHRHPRERDSQPQKAPERKETDKPEASKKQSKR